MANSTLPTILLLFIAFAITATNQQPQPGYGAYPNQPPPYQHYQHQQGPGQGHPYQGHQYQQPPPPQYPPPPPPPNVHYPYNPPVTSTTTSEQSNAVLIIGSITTLILCLIGGVWFNSRNKHTELEFKQIELKAKLEAEQTANQLRDEANKRQQDKLSRELEEERLAKQQMENRLHAVNEQNQAERLKCQVVQTQIVSEVNALAASGAKRDEKLYHLQGAVQQQREDFETTRAEIGVQFKHLQIANERTERQLQFGSEKLSRIDRQLGETQTAFGAFSTVQTELNRSFGGRLEATRNRLALQDTINQKNETLFDAGAKQMAQLGGGLETTKRQLGSFTEEQLAFNRTLTGRLDDTSRRLQHQDTINARNERLLEAGVEKMNAFSQSLADTKSEFGDFTTRQMGFNETLTDKMSLNEVQMKQLKEKAEYKSNIVESVVSAFVSPWARAFRAIAEK